MIFLLLTLYIFFFQEKKIVVYRSVQGLLKYIDNMYKYIRYNKNIYR